jgi:nucleoside-diphosphate-sugar epimerase
MNKILILGVNGFIGHHLSTRILNATDWRVFGMDMNSDRIAPLRENPRFQFFEGDITINHEWIEYHIKKCDVVLPLVAIATPATYVREPLRVFELDFEANLAVVRLCVKHRKRVLFPSTSEVYGMCHDSEFDPYASELVYGPIEKPRWIYACSKQLLDRVIHAYGMRDELDYTLFRPFNWIGPGLDNMHAAKEGSSRVITQFLGHIARAENVQLVDGGGQRRCFTGISDGIEALMLMIENRNGRASRRIYNVGNPANSLSVRELASEMLSIAASYPEYRENAAKVRLVDTTAAEYYGKGYQDVEHRVPKIDNTRAELGWTPRVTMQEALRQIFDAYRGEIALAGQLLEQEPRP